MKKLSICSALLLCVALSACGKDAEKKERSEIDAQVTQTRMDDIDKIEGTINDDMINSDTSTDTAALAKDDKASGTE